MVNDPLYVYGMVEHSRFGIVFVVLGKIQFE